MDASIEREFLQLQDTLRHKAPQLRPRITPREYSDQKLLNLAFKHQSSKNKFFSQIEKLRLQYAKCSLCQQPCGAPENTQKAKLVNTLNFVFDFSVDITKRHLKVESGLFLCEMCDNLFNLEKFLHVACTDNLYVEQLIQHFFTVNNIDLKSKAERMQYLQECYSLAFSLKILARYLRSSLFLVIYLCRCCSF
jgi:hypothetical protein